MKTIKLDPTIVTPVWMTQRRRLSVPLPLSILIVVACLIGIGLIVGRMRSMPSVLAHPTPALALPAIIIIQTAQPVIYPTAIPATPDQQVYQELAALRARVAELEAAAPQVVEQTIYVSAAAPEPAADAAPPLQQFEETAQDMQAALTPAAPPSAPIVVDDPLKVRAESDCGAEHGRCTPPCTSEHGRCSAEDTQ